MHILLMIAGLIGAAAFWWYRLKYMGEAANEVVDKVGQVQGYFRRQKLRKKAAVAPVAAIDDPVVAAATVMMAIAAEDSAVSEALEARVLDAISPIAATPEKATEAVTYAKWASDQVADVPTVIDQAGGFLSGKLDEAEREQLVDMVAQVTPAAERHAMFAQRIERLRRRLGLVVKR